MENRNKLLFLNSLIFLFLISFSSSYSTVTDTLPDLCLPNNLTSYNINLSQYWNIDLSETIYIDYIDPYSGDPMSLPAGYYTVNTECWEMAYYFLSGNDILSIETLDDVCSFDLTIDFQDSPGVDQTFNVNVSDACETPTLPINNGTCSYVDNLYSHDISSTWSHYGSPDTRYCQFLSLSNTNMTNLSFYFETVYTSGSYTVDFRVRNDISDSVVLEKNLYTSRTSDINVNWYTVVFDTPAYLDGDYKICMEFSGMTDTDLRTYYATPSDLSGQYYTIYDGSYTDDTSKDLEYKYGYSTCEDVNASSGGLIPDVNMSGNTTTHLDVGSYFNDWTNLRLYFDDPITSFTYTLLPGYTTINFDYYDIFFYPNGSIDIISYNRSYNFDVIASASNGIGSWINDTFNINIVTELGEVEQRYPFTYINYLDDNFKMFSGNYYFQYYTDIYVIYPENNDSGILNSEFPYLYNNVDNHTLNIYSGKNYDYLVYVYCDITQEYEEKSVYNGSLGVFTQCGNNEFYITFYNGSDETYNNKVYFYAYNYHSNITDYTNLSYGIELVKSTLNGSGTYEGSNYITGIYSDFAPLFEQDGYKNVEIRNIVMRMIILFWFGLIAMLFYRTPAMLFKIFFYTLIPFLFFFAYINWITYYWGILLTFLCMVHLYFTEIRGNG